ncbi:MAG TPA: hypothetical protein VL769_14360 [Acidimicrobiia bacterium]|jgi:hypothetical protein|nr:hypothetical protein [Acidimicrobiia bacterium]
MVTTSFVTDTDVVEGAGGRVVVVDDDVVVVASEVADDALEPVVGAGAVPDGPELEHAAPNVSDTATNAAAVEPVSGRSRG